MARVTKVDSKSYYNTLPPLGHECGDIWRNLPSFGMLGETPCAGIVITPACDLSWQKSDTLTYLPIVPIRTFFSMEAALPAVIERVCANLQTIGYELRPEWSAQTYVPPSGEELTSLQTGLEQYRSAQQRPAKVLAAIDRTVAGIEILHAITHSELNPIASEKLSVHFGAEWAKIKDRLIRNSYSPALHFLPHDGQNAVFSGVREHSVVLFRYPITVPVKMLNYAEETSDSAWADRVESLNLSSTMKNAFFSARPVKMLSLKAAFLSDLLTRFSALYNRIGSPDFTKETVDLYSSQVDI
ncbi:hypothetical protein [Mesorhizobium sp. M1163]|uniref:hypothetical protein n=1 Tax=unclassified Mesorhizobium TaxID=325217 RepID=UPI003335ED03